jgi:tetratricopeptide (TPR) repeat protein
MRFYLLPTALLLLSASASLADNAQTVEDCEYWRLGADDAEKASRLAACDTVIGNKRFAEKDRAMAYAERAGRAQNDNRATDAIADLSQAIALAPEQIEWVRDRGFLYHLLPEYARALEDFNAYLAAKPDNAHVTFYRGLTQLELGNETSAFADMAKAIELDPKDAFKRYWRAKVFAKGGNVDAALADLGEAVRLDPAEEDHYVLRQSPTTPSPTSTARFSTSKRASSISRSPTTTRCCGSRRAMRTTQVAERNS